MHLAKVFAVLAGEPRPVEELRDASQLGAEEFDKALEKLQIHGGARVDFSGNGYAGGPAWKKTYAVQAAISAEQFEKVLRLTSIRTTAGCARWCAILAM